MRLLCAAILTATVGVFVVNADDKKDTPVATQGADRPAQYKALIQKFTEDIGDLEKRFVKASTAAEKNAIRTEARELATITAGKFVALAKDNPKDETALKALAFVIQQLMPLGAGKDGEAAVDLVIEHHLNSPEMKNFIQTAGMIGPAGEKLLKAAADKSTDKTVKGMALFFLGTALAEQADNAVNPKKAADLSAQALKYFEEAVKTAPEARIGRDTLAKAAAGEIETLKKLSIGQPAPEVEGVALDGKKVKLSSYKGKVVLVDIWATWCPPCRAMIPHERDMVKKLSGKPFVLLSVSVDDQKADLTKFLDKEPMPWDHWWDGEAQKVAETFRVKAFPTLYLLDANGVIRRKWVGAPDSKELDGAIDELVAEATKGKK